MEKIKDVIEYLSTLKFEVSHMSMDDVATCVQNAQNALIEIAKAKNVRQEVLQAAIDTVCHDREDQYGNPENNFEAISHFWSVYLNATLGTTDDGKLIRYVTPDDVAAMMMLLKIARIATGAPKRDNWVDAAGYAGCGAEIQSKNWSE